MLTRKKVLFVSNSNSKNVNQHMFESFANNERLQVEVVHLLRDNYKESIIDKAFVKLKMPLNHNKVNKNIIAKVLSFKPELVFIVKGNNIYPWTLKKIKKINPNINLISWSLDDMYAWHNRSVYYTFGIKYYDLVFTSKSYNVLELEKLGAKKVYFLYQAYSKTKHLIEEVPDCNNLKRDVLFIGYAESDRFESIKFLVENGIKVHVFGTGWELLKRNNKYENLYIHARNLLGAEYREFISSSKINLCFLRKINRDLHTSRSLEIPACGGFMVAERTREHEDLFNEKIESAYFSNNNELLSIVKHYLTNEKERCVMTKRALRKCQDLDYSYDSMLKKILITVEDTKKT